MIYLFNSASRPLYALDVLSVLALPAGATIVHRYRASGDYVHVHPDLYDCVRRDRPTGVRPARRGRDWLVRLGVGGAEAERVVISFVDRSAPGGYVYHPLRLGTLFDAWERDERVYFRVQLGPFVAPQRGRASLFTAAVVDALKGKQPPALAGGGATAANDGYYSLEGLAEPFIRSPDLLEGERAWVATTDALAGTEAFRSSADRTVVFLRSQIQRLGSDADPKLPHLFGGAERMLLRKDSMYELRLSYRCPGHALGAGTLATLEVQHGDRLQVLEAAPLPINAAADDIVVPITTKRYTDERYSYLNVAAQSHAPTAVVLAPKLNVLLGLREGRGFWLQVVLALLAFAGASLVVGLDATKLGEVWALPLAQVPQGVWDRITPPRAAAALLQAAVLFWLFRLIGKKPV